MYCSYFTGPSRLVFAQENTYFLALSLLAVIALWPCCWLCVCPHTRWRCFSAPVFPAVEEHSSACPVQHHAPRALLQLFKHALHVVCRLALAPQLHNLQWGGMAVQNLFSRSFFTKHTF